MKVLFIDVNYKYSSTGKIVDALYKRLKKEGYEAAVCYGRGKKEYGDHIYKFGIDFETMVHAALSRITGYNGYFSPISTYRLISYIKKYNPDIIHIHELHAYFVNIKPLLKYIKKKNIKVVWTFHCEYMYTGKCGIAYECKNYMNGCGNCPRIHDYPKSLFFDQTKKMFRMKQKMLEKLKMTIVTPSNWLAERVNQSFLKDKDKIVIHNGVDTSIFHPVNTEKLRHQLNIPKEKKIILFVVPDLSNELKGSQWVIRIAKLMKKEPVIFLVVGAGKQPKETLDNVIYVGPIYEQQLLAQFYSLANVFLLCSKRETYSMTCAEALCCGTPVVGFKCGAPETVFTEPFATFSKYGDIDAIKGNIENVLKDNIDCSQCKKYYSEEHMTKKYLDLYKTDKK